MLLFSMGCMNYKVTKYKGIILRITATEAIQIQFIFLYDSESLDTSGKFLCTACQYKMVYVLAFAVILTDEHRPQRD